jgi:hypothetical protein
MAAQPYQLTGYESDLSDAEWEFTKALLYPADAGRRGGKVRGADCESLFGHHPLCAQNRLPVVDAPRGPAPCSKAYH